MKVLHLGKYFPPYRGGMETYLRDVMVGLARRGIRCSALVHGSTRGWRSTSEQLDVAGQSVSITRAAVWFRALFTPISPVFPLLLNRLIATQQPTLLHLHLPNVSAFWALLVPRARRLPWVVHWHSDVPLGDHSLGLRLLYRLYKPWERALLRRCSHIIATSPPYRQSSVPLQPFLDKCTVVPLGLDPGYLDPTEVRTRGDAPAAEPGSLRVLAVGRFTYYKGFAYLLEAAATLPSVRVELVGSGDLVADLRRQIDRLGLTDRVALHGNLGEVALARLYHNCDCLCLPSIERTEAFGLVLLEAMYCGKATVASEVPGSGMSWVVDHGITGLLVPPQNATALAAALRLLSEQRDKLASFGANGRRKFDRQFHINHAATGLEAVYSGVLKLNSPDTR